MYTKARIAKHPIHPMLVAFPIALYAATVVVLIVHAYTRDPFWYRVAMYTNLSGVVMAAIAAVPGLVDLLGLPAHSTARVTGFKHAGFNILALVMFAASGAIIYGNWTGHHELADASPLALAAIGIVSTVTAGWFGWTMVQTHHVGVKPSTDPTLRSPEDLDDLDELNQIPVPVGMHDTTPQRTQPQWRH